MKIGMFTNTFTPHVGGVAQSVLRFTESLRGLGEDVLVVAPEYDEKPEDDSGVARVPAMQNFNGSDFSMPLPVKPDLRDEIDAFQPTLLHAHHPYLLGDTALRVAAERNIPLVFTHHTMYEHYTHYTPVDTERIETFVIRLSTGYANLCDAVVAPSESVAGILRERGVETPITVIPTGVDLKHFHRGDGAAFRQAQGIPDQAPVIGHVGRLAEEKNLSFLTECLLAVMERNENAWLLVVGDGDERESMEKAISGHDAGKRSIFTGVLSGQNLVDAYHAMDTFAFASTTETQGMVLVEALAAGCPVAALDAPGAREVVRDGENGALVQRQDVEAFAEAVCAALETADSETCRESVARMDEGRCAERLLELYRTLTGGGHTEAPDLVDEWNSLRRALSTEWDLWSNRASALADAALGPSE